jgi:esterase/lipase superfamily enzyme
MSRLILILVLLVSLGACAARGVVSLVPGATAPGAVLQTVFVASNRQEAAQGAPNLFQTRFGGVRDPQLRFARLTLSIPPVHQPGQIEWPGEDRPDPARHFVVTQETRFDRQQAFLAALDDEAGHDVVVFVHGFNVNNAEATYRLAQIAHDFDARGPVIAYSWPSAGSPRGYAYDRDSVIFSRDGLEDLLVALTDKGQRVLVVAHSMGSQLVMEVLRQLAISGQGHVLSRLNGVALISPDIDEDVFRQQATRITSFPQPFMLIVSSRDRALGLSAFLTGKPARLGSIEAPERLDDLPLQVVDLSEIRDGDRSGHTTAFTAPAAIRLLRDLAPD